MMRWTPELILNELSRLHARGTPLGYRALSISNQPLVSAAAYHFGSFKKAVEQAGFVYADISGRPRWTKERVIRQIKAARRAGQDLSWTAVTAKDTPLRRAAYVAIQKRMFGGWPRALQVSGIDGDESCRYQTWDKTSVVLELKQRHADGKPMNSASVKRQEPSLHAAALRYHKSFDAALRAAGFEPSKVRQRRKPRRD